MNRRSFFGRILGAIGLAAGGIAAKRADEVDVRVIPSEATRWFVDGVEAPSHEFGPSGWDVYDARNSQYLGFVAKHNFFDPRNECTGGHEQFSWVQRDGMIVLHPHEPSRVLVAYPVAWERPA